MKYSIILSLFFIIISSCKTEVSKSRTLVPYPNSVSVIAGSFTIYQGINILSSHSSLNPTISFFIKKLNDLEIDTNDKSDKIIDLELVRSSEIKSESYKLDVNKKRIKLTASDSKGVFYGLMMAIVILPTIAKITGAKLPDNKIDGKNVWDIWTGNSSQSPHEAYYFYYHINELHGIRYGKWKMYST